MESQTSSLTLLESFPNLIGEKITIASNDTNTLIERKLEITNNSLSMDNFNSFQNLLFNKITAFVTSQNTLQNLIPEYYNTLQSTFVNLITPILPAVSNILNSDKFVSFQEEVINNILSTPDLTANALQPFLLNIMENLSSNFAN
jgi:hypothetical protein